MIDYSKFKLKFIFDIKEEEGRIYLKYNGETCSWVEFYIKPKFKVGPINRGEMLFDFLGIDFINTETNIDALFEHELVKEAYDRHVGEKYKMLRMYR